ncbi:HEAT repeat domain-containing protein [Gloeobacter violaceus]|uniref:CpeZ protein n=1 Tax=Gloeobacter violaceus (strain ATCC 29082 / PCC 7421) TaxID=251221 RepID=Q7NLD9_GLOVI|nr:HEAT repeat domain-containing protein [Gloeobacter violaceus]BAC89128.1 cpeZ [Gloeobacter violaceus PCC 7421]
MSLEETYPQLKHKNPRLRERAMHQVAQERTEDTLAQLMAVLAEEDVTYRRTAVQTLGIIGPDALPALAQQLTIHPNATVRASCAKALAAIALNYPEVPFAPVGLEALSMALGDRDPVVKLSAVGALGTVGSPAFEILAAALDLDDLAVSMAVIGALASVGDPRGRTVLASLAARPNLDAYLYEAATGALSRLAEHRPWNSGSSQ